jgi:tripartite ATP-independent transporter DctM subunit
VALGAVLALSVIEAWESAQATLNSRGQSSTIASIPLVLYTAPFAVAFALWAAASLARIARDCRSLTGLAGGALGAAVIVVPLAATQSSPMMMDNTKALSIGFIIMLALLLLGTPLSFVLLSGAYLANTFPGLNGPQELPLDLVSSTNDILLLSIPFFIFVGYLLTDSSLSRPLTRFFDSLVGHLRGGEGLIALVSMYVFSGISGSKVSDVAAVSASLRGILDDEHDESAVDQIRPGERAGLFCGAAVAGETIPPSLVLLVLGSVTSLSITKLFLAGILPSVLMFVLLAAYAVVVAGRSDGPRKRWVGPRTTAHTAYKAIPALLIPLILLAGIGAGLTTPLEAAVVAAAYAIVLTLLYNRSRSFTITYRVVRRVARYGGSIIILILFAVPLARQITLSSVADDLASLIGDLGGGKFVFIAISVLALVIFGQLLEGLPAILLFGPILMPLATQFGVPTLQYAILLTVGLGLGAFSPPFGVGLFSTIAVEDTTLGRTIGPWARYISVVVVGIVLLAVIPAISTFLPSLLDGT